MKKFTYNGIENCYFVVSSYCADKNVIAFSIENDDGFRTVCTVYDKIMSIADENIATIKNYSENSHMTEFLEKLGVVTSIIYRTPCNNHVLGTLKTKNPQTIDTCFIDTNVLKEYCKEWHYEPETVNNSI